MVAPTRVNGWRVSRSVRAPGPLPDDDVDRAVLHRRVEDLLDGAVEPVDLVDEEDVALLEGGEDGGQVALAVERRPRDGVDAALHLAGHDVGQGRLAQAGRPGQQHVVEWLAPGPGGVEEDGSSCSRM